MIYSRLDLPNREAFWGFLRLARARSCAARWPRATPWIRAGLKLRGPNVCGWARPGACVSKKSLQRRPSHSFLKTLNFLEQINVFFICKARLGDQLLKKPDAKILAFVKRYREMNVVASFLDRDIMGAFNMIDLPTSSFEGSYMSVARGSRKLAHMLTL